MGTLTIEKKRTSKEDASKSTLLASPAHIWSSRISWTIAFYLFLLIALFQTLVLILNIDKVEQQKLAQVREIGRAAIAPVLSASVTDMLTSPASNEGVQRLLNNTIVRGMTIYNNQLDLIKSYGEPMALVLMDQNSLGKTFRTANGDSYEVVYRGGDLGRPYVVTAKLDSSKVADELNSFIRETIIVTFILSGLATSVLMIAIGKLLLEPILFMRENLMAASREPEDPKISPSPFDPRNEIGSAIAIAQKLIRQNADNIKRIKSAAEDKIHKLAYYDTLTGLPNRTSFLQTLSECLRAGTDNEIRRYAVVALDLDHFKDINDSMGHNVGDAILRGVGRRLRMALPDTATVSRTGEDEFAVTLPLNTDLNTARDVGARILNVIRNEPFKVFNEAFQVRASVGVATFPDDGVDPDQVLKNADIALNRAKEEGRDTIKEYSEDFDRVVQQRFQLLRDLRDALEQDQLTLHYQPQLDLKTGKIIGSEALIRWWKPDNSKQGGTYISPGEFIPVAEQSGLIVPIGEWVMREACKQARLWQTEHGMKDVRVAVNVSAAQFSQSDIVDFVRKTLKEVGLEARMLELEVTESVFMADINHTIQTLQNLHALGVELAIDDFGTGYSSLSYLRQFPIDRLKIDQSFIRNALNNQDDAAIARTIVRLAHSLSLKVIAEGVETREHELFLLEEGCDEVQGYRYSKPLPVADFVKFTTSYDGTLDSFDRKMARA
ncbi:MAG: EAL domain-containing protein [Alphaproteobacteria bacterium]|nr:EAL domain-containing protein [Alphaproteobacteria bacterium]